MDDRKIKLAQIMVPHATDDGYYNLYVFNMFTKVVHVMDPSNTWQLEVTLDKKHHPICKKLLKGMSSLIGEIYPGFHLDLSKWSVKCHHGLNGRMPR